MTRWLLIGTSITHSYIPTCQTYYRKDVRLDLILVMVYHHFWVQNLQTISSYSQGLPGGNDVLGQSDSILR